MQTIDTKIQANDLGKKKKKKCNISGKVLPGIKILALTPPTNQINSKTW
jgi:hypothetical protein